MENKLDITKEIKGSKVLLKADGRMDGSLAVHLEEDIDIQIRDGFYDIDLDLTGVYYISSAGIRVLVNKYKKLHEIGGSLQITAISETVKSLLELVGMYEMFLKGAPKPKSDKSKLDSKIALSEEFNGYRFENKSLDSSTPMQITISGTPEKTKTSSYSEEDNKLIPFNDSHFALGLGALGTGYEDCKNRYGEFIAFDNAIAYMPTDGSKIPDYSLKTGKLIPEINALYAIKAQGDFSNLISFNAIKNEKSIALSEIIEACLKISGKDKLLMLMIAESSGLVGFGLSKSPVDGSKTFSFPEVKENINFTTDPAHDKMLTVSLGFISKNEDESIKSFLRPTKPESSQQAHVHSAVFTYQALRKETSDYKKLIAGLFENSELRDILHLVNDSREINGLGESRFKYGYCWIAEITN